MTVTLITKLELRSEPIPRGPIIERLEQEIGRPLTHETRHYLAGQPVHCGDTLELYLDGAVGKRTLRVDRENRRPAYLRLRQRGATY